ncbi:ROK family protein [Utexia brackfieldae]|uniref:ROK family protein n=1 Tax=Utexia brackfieldae TaxID=3074108 RepID=UPI00370D2A3C
MALNYLNVVGNTELVKQLNYAMIYRLIAQHSPISRIQLAEISHLAPASITKITKQLLKNNLIKEVDAQQSTGGRPAVSIIVQTSLFQTIAIQFSRTDITIELYDLDGKSSISETYPLSDFTQRLAENYLLTIIDNFIQHHQTKIKKLIAIAIVMPGLIDAEKGVIKYTPHIKVNDWQISQSINKKFATPCFIGNDVQSLALAESYFGSTQDTNDSILIRVHHGIGSGVIINQQLFVNYNQSMGEIGHIHVDPLGERCHCGNFGCLENSVINCSIESRAKRLIEQGYNTLLTLEQCHIKHICQFAQQGDKLCTDLIRQAGKDLGYAVAMLINLFNPQKIVIAGEISKSDQILFPAIQSVLDSQALKVFRDSVKLSSSTLNDCSAIGAFALVQQAMFSGRLLMDLLSDHTE